MAYFIFRFNKKNERYIAALKAFHGNALIDNINGRDVKEVRCSELSDVLNDVPQDDIVLTTRAKLNSSSVGVFPACARGKDYPFYDLLTEGDQVKYLKSSEYYYLHANADQLIHYLIDRDPLRGTWMHYYSTQGEDQEVDGQIARASFNWPAICNGLPFKKEMKQSEALLLLAALNEKINFSGMVHFPNQEKIFIQYDNRNFVLSYGKYNFISVLNIDFDIDSGFIFGIHAGSRDYLPSELEIKSALDAQYTAWKGRGYQGMVIEGNTLIVPKIHEEDLILSWPEDMPQRYFDYIFSHFFPMVQLKFQESLIPKLAASGDLTSLKNLMNDGYQLLNVPCDNAGNTPLMLAAKEGHDRVVKWLLCVGVDKHAKNILGGTASDVARASGHIKLSQTIERATSTSMISFFPSRGASRKRTLHKRKEKRNTDPNVLKETSEMVIFSLGSGSKK